MPLVYLSDPLGSYSGPTVAVVPLFYEEQTASAEPEPPPEPSRRLPHACPVCRGTGKATDPSITVWAGVVPPPQVTCSACGGACIIWSPA